MEEVREGSRPKRIDPPPRPRAVEVVEVPAEVVVGVAVEAPKRTPTPLTTPRNQTPRLTQNEESCPVWGRLKSFAHLRPLVTSDQFVLQTVTKGYRIEFTGNPLRTKEARFTPIPRNQARRQDLERGLESMLAKRAIREIPLSTDVLGFYSPIFLVALSLLAPSTGPSAGKDLAEAFGPSVQSTRASPHGSDSHSLDTTNAPQTVDASFGQPIHPNIPGPRVGHGIGVVGITGQPDGRPSVPQARSVYDDSYGCLHGRLGRSPRRLGDLGPVVVGLGQTPHQLARAPGSVADFAAFPASGTGHCCGCPYGQFHHSGLYQQGGRDSVPHLVLPGTGPMGLVQATWNLPGCQPHIGGQERLGGRPVQGETQPPYGVVPPQDSGAAHFRALANPSCGSLRVGEESQTSGVLLGTPLSDVERDKRSDAELGESVRVRVPADKPHSEGTEKIEAAVVSPDPPSS